MQDIKKFSPPRVVCLMYPSMGILDNWLPVLSELKQRRPDLKITALLPRQRVVAEIDLAEVTMRLGEQVFDEVVYKSRAGFWARAESFAQTKALAERSRTVSSMIGTVRAVFWYMDAIHFLRPLIRPVALMADKFLQRLGALSTDETYADMARIGRDTTALCFDLFALTKVDGRDIIRYFQKAACFSIQHGLNIVESVGDGVRIRRAPARIVAYAYSKHETVAYKHNYGLGEGEIKVIGVPRHESRWIEKILRESKRDMPESWGRYIFLISRPANSEFLTKEKKRQALEDLRRLAFDDLGCKIVVKLHPTELVPKNNDALLYEQTFDNSMYGKRWRYSSTHPFVLGERSMFAVAFYSGVPVDMLALGVPTIELRNIGGAGEEGAGAAYRSRGLVLPADNYEELKRHADAIIHDRAAVIQQLLPQYEAFFGGAHKQPICVIADDICRALDASA
ncbi:MAG: hypothetical protein Q8R39_03440 [bacterium]|nr:hypothetical protein [bacterium]